MTKTSRIAVARAAVKSYPNEIFNWYLVVCTVFWSFSGVAKGFDEATAGAVFGCLGCISLTQRLGRKTTMAIGTVVYMAGIFGQTFCAPSLEGLYASRFVAGLGIGVTTVLPSVYISEIAPRSICGLCTLQYAACQQLGVVFGLFFNYGVTRHHEGTQLQWQLPTALHLIPAVIWGTGILLCPESPRFLISQGKTTKAIKTLVNIRRLPESHPYVKEELAGIEAQINHEIESVAGSNVFDLLKETFVDIKDRRRFALMFLCNLFSQWSGANAITQYSTTIIEYLGITGTEQMFLITGIYAIVKFTSTLLFSIFIIDFVGRSRSLMTGISLQIITVVFICAYLGVTNGWTTEQIDASPSAKADSTGS